MLNEKESGGCWMGLFFHHYQRQRRTDLVESSDFARDHVFQVLHCVSLDASD
jgi:hypothetical protein